MSVFPKTRQRILSAIAGFLLAGSSAAIAANHEVYSDTADAKAEIRQALATAAREHKRVLLDFGGNWCGDCIVLHLYLQDPGNASLLQNNFVPVYVNIGRYDKNLDIAKQYNIPLEKGVPALAILDPNGKLVYSQRNGEFESMRRMDVSSVSEFLTKWKPAPLSRAAVPCPTNKKDC
jgi:thioredoxin 1